MAIIKTIKCIDYNVWMSIMTYFENALKVRGESIVVKPSYPRDLSKLNKPSIIVQKVGYSQSRLCFGNFMGQQYDSADDTLSDVSGSQYDLTYQIDVYADGNISCSYLTSTITDILEDIRISNSGIIDIMDYAKDNSNPEICGRCKLIGDIDVIGIESDKDNKNNTYINAIRFDLVAIQTIVHADEYIDLGKWIKYNQRIRL